ncbi:MAG: ABC transporter ATP-binding protein/permease [bacterium]|nr:ABC transporter ATP-binding protein/permease [bacterium]
MPLSIAALRYSSFMSPSNPIAEEHNTPQGFSQRFSILKRTLQFAKPETKRFSWGGLLLLLSIITTLGQPLVFRQIFDVHLVQKDEFGLILSATLFFVLIGLTSVFQYLKNLLLGTAGVTIVNHFKREVYDHMLKFEIPFFEQNPVGRLVSRIESDCERLVGLFTRVGLQVISTILLLLGTLVILYTIDWKLAILLTFIVFIIFIGAITFFHRMRPMFQEERAKIASVTAVVSEFTQGARLLRIFQREEFAKKRLREVNDDKVRYSIRIFLRFAFFFTPVGMIQVCLVGWVLWFGAGLSNVGAYSIGTIVMFAQYITQLFRPLFEFTEQIGEIQRALGAADRLYELLDRKPKVENPTVAVPVPILSKAIQFENIFFHYHPSKPILFNIHLEIPVGTKLALVGPTGGGKTTLINLLCRFYDPVQGRILWDGIDIRNFQQEEYRKKIGLVLQDLYLFPGTVQENLSVLRTDVPIHQVEQAIEQLGLWDIFQRFPKGLDTVFSERSANISYGERQLVAFTRALVFQPELLILDEATSSVDPETERKIEKTLETLLHNRTAVIVAHRLSTIRNADKIAVIQKGRLVELGNHDELIRKNGYYAHLYRIQFPEANHRDEKIVGY